jgi:fatty acid desaturase
MPKTADLARPDREATDLDAAKAALDQVHKRQDALLAIKTSTENRALTLAGQCLTALVAVTGAGFWAANQSPVTWPVLAATIAGGLCLLWAVWSALRVIRPRHDLTLPGRLPDELWQELTWPGIKGADFILHYLRNAQDTMVRNELAQHARAAALHATVRAAALAVPAAVGSGVVVALCV